MEIINDILDLSKIDAGQMPVNIEQVRLDVLVSDVMRLMTMRAEEQGLVFEVAFEGKLPRVIQTDPLRLRPMLLNLVGNAIKFTSDGSIRIVVRHMSPSSPTPLPEAGNGQTDPACAPGCQIQFDVIDTGLEFRRSRSPDCSNHSCKPTPRKLASTAGPAWG